MENSLVRVMYSMLIYSEIVANSLRIITNSARGSVSSRMTKSRNERKPSAHDRLTSNKNLQRFTVPG